MIKSTDTTPLVLQPRRSNSLTLHGERLSAWNISTVTTVDLIAVSILWFWLN